jgi:hypothetical protein
VSENMQCFWGALVVSFAVTFIATGGVAAAFKLLSSSSALKLRRPRVEHVPELGESLKPFVVNGAAKFRVKRGLFFLKVKLLFEKLFLKSVGEGGCDDRSDDGSKNGSAGRVNECFHGVSLSDGQSMRKLPVNQSNKGAELVLDDDDSQMLATIKRRSEKYYRSRCYLMDMDDEDNMCHADWLSLVAVPWMLERVEKGGAR